MERIDRMLAHPAFRSALEELESLEADRIFCRHGLEHLLSVARLMRIYNLEQGLGLDSELLYAAALLHDIGRGAQYTQGIPHEAAGVALAGPILEDCGFSARERDEILAAISSHRGKNGGAPSELGRLLYRADKQSRPCFACPASDQCNWPEEKKNHSLEY